METEQGHENDEDTRSSPVMIQRDQGWCAYEVLKIGPRTYSLRAKLTNESQVLARDSISVHGKAKLSTKQNLQAPSWLSLANGGNSPEQPLLSNQFLHGIQCRYSKW